MPWPNWIVGRRKFSTCVYLRLRLASWLACTCVDLRWRALTLLEIKFAHKSTQVFHRLATQPKSTQVEWRSVTHHQPMKYRICLPWNGFLETFVHLRGNLRVRLATQCNHLPRYLRPLRVRLTRTLLNHKSKMTSNCCVFKIPCCNVDWKHLTRFESENATRC